MICLSRTEALGRLFQSACQCAGLAIAMLLISGCGGNEMGLEDAYGTVTLDGQPLVDAQIIFHSQKGDVYARTDQAGKYEMELSTSLRGAFPGENAVRITTAINWDATDEDDDEEEEEEEYGAEGVRERVPAKYNMDSELTVDVKSGGAPYDFALTSD